MYEMKGIRRLMAAVLLRAIRDVYASDKVTRYLATEWLQRSSIEYINRYGLKVSQWRLSRWIENGFQLEDLGDSSTLKAESSKENLFKNKERKK